MARDKKAIHDLLSPKIAEKRRRRHKIAMERAREAALKRQDPEGPAEVDNFKVNKPLFGPHRIKENKNAPVVERKISPNEGAPTVNAKSGKDIKPLIHKPRPVKPQIDPATGAIDKKPEKKGDKRRSSKKTRRRKSAN